MICGICGGGAILVQESRPFPVGSRMVVIDDEFIRCARCGEEYYEGEMADQPFRRAAAKIREEDGLLGPDDIIALREKYGLSQAALERLIGAGEKTVVRWERGTVAQNKTADTLLRVLDDHPEAVAQLARERGVELRSRKRAARTRAPKPKASPAPARRARADVG
jgi:HTH-type transcriptional regulator/antitoxin MqsA